MVSSRSAPESARAAASISGNRAEGVTPAGNKQRRRLQLCEMLPAQLLRLPGWMQRVRQQQQRINQLGFRWRPESTPSVLHRNARREKCAKWRHPASVASPPPPRAVLLIPLRRAHRRPMRLRLAERQIAPQNRQSRRCKRIRHRHQQRRLQLAPALCVSTRAEPSGADGVCRKPRTGSTPELSTNSWKLSMGALQEPAAFSARNHPRASARNSRYVIPAKIIA